MNISVYGDNSVLIPFCNEIESPDTIIQRIKEEVKLESLTLRGGDIPRLVAAQGVRFEGCEPFYRYPTDVFPSFTELTPTVRYIKETIEKMTGADINHVVIQFYRDGKDFIGEHCDKTLDIKVGTPIINYSVGATRTMVIKKKEDRSISEEIRLSHNSCLRMSWNTNLRWLHSIRVDKREDKSKSKDELAFGGERISFTMRNIATFLTPEGKIFGQGSTAKTKESAAVMNNDDLEKLFRAFKTENTDPNFDWEGNYGCGFDCSIVKEK